MATSYISSATAATNGASFNLTSGSSRVFYCEPPLAHGESCVLQITPNSGTDWFDVGDICINGEVSTVTAQGAGASDFRVNKGLTGTATEVWYD